MQFNTDKLKNRIIEKFETQERFADAMCMPKSTLSRLLANGKDWKGTNLLKAVELLDIPTDEISSYFFEPAVSKSKPPKT